MTNETAPAGHYEADVNHSSVLWRIKHLGLAWYVGRFSRFSAALEFRPDAVESMRLQASVDLRSVRTEYQGGDKDWDRELAEDANLLDALRHPLATYASTTVERTGEATARVTGNLDFRGIAQPLVLDVSYNGSLVQHRSGKPHVGFSARGTLLRSRHGLDFLLGPLMPDEVELLIEAQLMLAA
ncbi:YceI family protein [Methylobacterium sp. JK268]